MYQPHPPSQASGAASPRDVQFDRRHRNSLAAAAPPRLRLPRSLGGMPQWLTALVVLLAIVPVVMPLSPNMPEPGLDPSWMYGVNQALAQGLVFGRDLVFTYGPYAPVYTKTYHPATDSLMLAGGLYLGLCYAFALLALRGRPGVRRPLLLAGLCAGFLTSRDALMFCYPLLLALITHRWVQTAADEPDTRSLIGRRLLAVLLFSTLGLLPLIKGSFLLLAGGIALLCGLRFGLAGDKPLAAISLAAPIVAVPLFWAGAGQPLAGLPDFFINLAPIVSGYTEAMASWGHEREIVTYLIAAGFVLYAAGTIGGVGWASRGFLLLAFAAFFFVVYKAAFVRHDGHAVTGGVAALGAALLLAIPAAGSRTNAAVFVALLAWWYIDANYVGSSTRELYAKVHYTYEGGIDGLKARRGQPSELDQRFAWTIGHINKQLTLPTLPGTTDIYPFHQSHLLAAGNTWSPRPVLQSYSAYTPQLAALNERHLTSSRAPDNILFKVETIDGRLPALDDGLSWPTLLGRYQPRTLHGDFLQLAKRAEPAATAKPAVVHEGRYRLDETVLVPSGDTPLFAEVDVRPSLAGRLVALLHKPKALAITVELRDGRTRRFRFVSGMGKAGFLLSPTIEHTGEFALLYANPAYLGHKQVKSIRIGAESGGGWLWQADYTLRLSTMALPPASLDIRQVLNFDAVEEAGALPVARKVQCDGFIDAINGVNPAPPQAHVGGYFSVEGWLAVSTKDGVAADNILVSLTDEQGRTAYIRTRKSPRDDVKAHFKHPGMGDLGFKATIDTTRYRGRLTLGLLREYRGRREHCAQFQLPVIVEPPGSAVAAEAPKPASG